MVVCNLGKPTWFSIEIGPAITNIGDIGGGADNQGSGHGCTHISSLFQVALVYGLIGALHTITQETSESLILYMFICQDSGQDVIDNGLNRHTTGILTICMTSHAICNHK